MATQPWVTPAEVVTYTDNSSIKSRAEEKLAVDISRAEAYVIQYCNNKFTDDEKYPEIPSSVKTAVILVAEVYANNSIIGSDAKKRVKSETYDDYSYSLESAYLSVADLDLASLLDAYVIATGSGKVVFKLRAI